MNNRHLQYVLRCLVITIPPRVSRPREAKLRLAHARVVGDRPRSLTLYPPYYPPRVVGSATRQKCPCRPPPAGPAPALTSHGYGVVIPCRRSTESTRNLHSYDPPQTAKWTRQLDAVTRYGTPWSWSASHGYA